jgi:hypothetical protein
MGFKVAHNNTFNAQSRTGYPAQPAQRETIQQPTDCGSNRFEGCARLRFVYAWAQNDARQAAYQLFLAHSGDRVCVRDESA